MTYPELVRRAAQEALAQANMDLGEIEAVVVAMAPSEFIGVNDPEKWVVEALGAQGKPLLRVHTGGATGGSAAQAGYFHVASGLYNAVLVVGADKVGETPDAQLVLNTIWDPIYEKDFALNAITMTAFQAARHMHKYGTTERQMALVAVRSRANATRNPYAHLKGRITVEEVLKSRLIAWPLKLYDCCPRSSGGAAVVVVNERLARERCSRPAWITGVGAVANTVFIGDRMGPRANTDYGDWDELAMAARQAYDMAGIKDPAREITVAEIYAPFTSTEIAAVEALGFCPKGRGGPMNEEGMFEMDGALPVNPSGGTLCANPIAVTALVRVCDAALQVMGRAGDYQVKGVRHAVATGIGGSLQFHTCMVLSSDYR
ncbi:MAG: thiolase family protein [Firmicutes bacterium]|nr:thiolase family protein [Bacillota bacterium]